MRNNFPFLFLSLSSNVEGLQNLIPSLPKNWNPFPTGPWMNNNPDGGSNTGVKILEDQLLAAIAADPANRLSSSQDIDDRIVQLETCGKSIARPAIAPQVYGRWRLLHTSNAATASPIQRKAVDASQFAIYQDITIRNGDDNIDSENTNSNMLIVSQIVQFTDTIRLQVDALGSNTDYPLKELTERQSTGTILGLNLLGISLVGEDAAPDPNRPDSRIDFVFDEGKFQIGESFQIPYPVPFRSPLFRDLVKGWIDITYLSERMRISRGNKGTTFVLVKED
jgi:PAP_fibrillin